MRNIKVKTYSSNSKLKKKNQLAWKIAEIASDSAPLNEKAIDINLKTYYKLRQGRLWAGFSYRNSYEGAQYLDGQLLKRQRLQLITPLIGIDYKDFIFSYNYSYQHGDIRFGSGGFHQITLGFNFLRGSIDCDCF